MNPPTWPRTLLIDRLGFERIEGSHRGAPSIRVASPDSNELATFEIQGYVERDGEEFVEYHERGARQSFRFVVQPPPPPKPKCSSCGAECEARSCTNCVAPLLAKALFRTDPKVIAFVDLVSDHLCWPSYEGADISYDKLEEAWEKAWDRNENGWRTECETKARALVAEIRQQMPTPPQGKGEP